MARLSCAVALVLATGAAFAEPLQLHNRDAGTTFLGAVAGQDWGRPLGAGDLDGDGYEDSIVAASEPYGGVSSQLYIVRGGHEAHRRGVRDLSSIGVDQVIMGAQLNDNLGSSIATGDLNTDGIDDLLVCASGFDVGGRADAGTAYVIYGGADFFASSTRDLAQTGNWDVRLVGPTAFGDMGASLTFGGGDTRAAAIGNFNGDAYGDIALGVHLARGSANAAGRVYVVFGEPFGSGITLDLAAGNDYDVVIYGDDEYDETGDFVLAGDITGDGLDDLIIPNQYHSQYLFDSEGAVHVFRGRENWNAAYRLAADPADITLLGHRKHDYLGQSAAVGDFNNDGITDLAAAAPGADAGAFDDQIGDGFVYGLLGSTDYQTGTHTIDFATANPDFLLIGDHQENLGAETSAGDFDGDGYDDIAASERFGGPQTNGIVEVLLGRDFAGNPTFQANENTDVRVVGDPQDRIGFSLSTSDVNGDGVREVFYGTPFSNNDAGTAYVLSLAVPEPSSLLLSIAYAGICATVVAGKRLPSRARAGSSGAQYAVSPLFSVRMKLSWLVAGNPLRHQTPVTVTHLAPQVSEVS